MTAEEAIRTPHQIALAIAGECKNVHLCGCGAHLCTACIMRGAIEAAIENERKTIRRQSDDLRAIVDSMERDESRRQWVLQDITIEAIHNPHARNRIKLQIAAACRAANGEKGADHDR